MIDKLWSLVAAVARLAVWCGAAMLLAAAAVVTAEVVLRKGVGLLVGTGFAFSGSDEISAYLFAVGTSWSMAHVLVTRGHVRIDALYGHFGPGVRAWLDLAALVLLALFAAVVLERAWDVASTSLTEGIRSNTPLRLPVAWAQIPWCAGFGLFLVALTVAILRALLGLARGEYASVSATAGVPTQDEEIAGELEGLGLRTVREKA